MARMHSRKKGKSGSTKPLKHVPTWSAFKGKEVEKLVVKYAKTGKSTSEVGVILRDSYGINNVKVLTGKKINGILAENKISKALPEDLQNLIKKMVSINSHMDKNKHDMTAKRGLGLTSSKIRRLVKYYKNTGKLSVDWQLDLNRLKMYLE